MKNAYVFLLVFLAFIVGLFVANWYINFKKTCFDLPDSGSTDVWGPKYWKAIHSISEKIPCSLCRQEGIELFSFVHDYVNGKTSKPIYNVENYYKWLDKFSEINAERKIENGGRY